MQDSKVPIESASVKVMRSYDYCHFEISLSTSMHGLENAVETVDELRKTAARLADKAVEQYKVAKAEADSFSHSILGLKYDALTAEKTPEDQRTPAQKADIKAYQDTLHAQRYNYEDDWQNY